ncbi:MAG: hypothetical protein U9Q69_03675, partial [Nanoarchaeota archaeon]|nr:hypothetical protein [Nanoarchaeota archaeon]
LSNYNLRNFSDVSIEDFVKVQGNNLLDAILFNRLFNSCARTKEDFKVEKDMDCLLYKQDGLFGRNLVFNGDGEGYFIGAKNITAETLESNGDGDWRFAWANNITAETLQSNGDGGRRFVLAKNITAETLESNGDGEGRFAWATNITAETLQSNGDGDGRFYRATSFTINGKEFKKFSKKDLQSLSTGGTSANDN